jgi:hypothetical protein
MSARYLVKGLSWVAQRPGSGWQHGCGASSSIACMHACRVGHAKEWTGGRGLGTTAPQPLAFGWASEGECGVLGCRSGATEGEGSDATPPLPGARRWQMSLCMGRSTLAMASSASAQVRVAMRRRQRRRFVAFHGALHDGRVGRSALRWNLAMGLGNKRLGRDGARAGEC